MADYKEALHAGFAAAKKAEAARKEIQTVLEKLKEDLWAASDGKLLVELREFVEPKELTAPFTPKALAGISLLQQYTNSLQDIKKAYALMASNPKAQNKSPKLLARWKQDKDGYPCSLAWGKAEMQYEDRAALEEGLAQLLRDPIIGEKLYALTKLD